MAIHDTQIANLVFPAGDDEYLLASLGFSLRFCLAGFSEVWINTNGVLSFGGPLNSYITAQVSTLDRHVLAPYWIDLDTSTGGTITYGTGTIEGNPVFMVVWSNVPMYNGATNYDPDLTVSFQIIITSREDISPLEWDVEYNYDSILFDTVSYATGPDSLARIGLAYPGFGVDVDTVSILDGEVNALNVSTLGEALNDVPLVPGTYINYFMGSAGDVGPRPPGIDETEYIPPVDVTGKPVYVPPEPEIPVVPVIAATWRCTARPPLNTHSGAHGYEFDASGPTNSQIVPSHGTCCNGELPPDSEPVCVVPTPELRTVDCPVGNTGSVLERRVATCPDYYGSPLWGDWVVVSSDCTPILVASSCMIGDWGIGSCIIGGGSGTGPVDLSSNILASVASKVFAGRQALLGLAQTINTNVAAAVLPGLLASLILGRTADINWVSNGVPISFSYKIAHNGTQFAIGGQAGTGDIAYGDTSSWSTANTGAGLYLRGLAASGSRFCSIHVDASGFGTYSYDSTNNGVSWSGSPSAMPSSQFWIDLGASPTSFIAIVGLSVNGIVARRTTTGSWSQSTPLTAANWQRVNWGNGTYIIVATAGRIAVSTDDGITWTDAIETGTSESLSDAAWNGNCWMAVATNGAMYKSATGLTGSWSKVRDATGQAMYTINQFEGVFYAPVYNTSIMVYSVDDGATWQNFALPTSGTYYDMAASATKLLAMSGSGVVSTS